MRNDSNNGKGSIRAQPGTKVERRAKTGDAHCNARLEVTCCWVENPNSFSQYPSLPRPATRCASSATRRCCGLSWPREIITKPNGTRCFTGDCSAMRASISAKACAAPLSKHSALQYQVLCIRTPRRRCHSRLQALCPVRQSGSSQGGNISRQFRRRWEGCRKISLTCVAIFLFLQSVSIKETSSVTRRP